MVASQQCRTCLSRLAAVCLLLVVAFTSPAKTASSQDGNSGGTCSSSLNIGLDYFLHTKLFANLTKVDLPTEVALPLSAFKIVNLRITGLDKVSRGCSLQLSVAGEARLRLKACARVARLQVSFVLKAVGFPVDFVSAALTDTSASAEVTVNMVPGGLIHLEAFDVALGDIEVENTGVTGAIITRIMRMSSVKKRVRDAIVAQGSKTIAAELKKHPLPK